MANVQQRVGLVPARRPRPDRRHVGPAIVGAVLLINLALWLILTPADDGRSGFARQVVAEMLASTTVLLFATSLALATRARFLEPYFGGLDRMYRIHRLTGQAGMVLLIVHVVAVPWRLTPGGGVPAGLIAFAGFVILVTLTVGPRLPILRGIVTISYRVWRHTHKFIGIFVIMSAAHMALVRPLAANSRPLFVIMIVAFAVGIVSYLYTILIARFVRPSYGYGVDAVRRLNESTIEIAMRPRRRKTLTFEAGQFVFVRIRRRGLREPHPFTVSSAPDADVLRVTIKAAGDFTTRLLTRVEPGQKVTVEGSYGMLDYRRGGHEQVWVAGGIGLTPFLSWMRSLDASTPHEIDFFYTVRTAGDALYWDEIRAIAARIERLRVHLNATDQDGRLTVEKLGELTGSALSSKDIYMCGPVPMITSLEAALRRAGVSKSAIHYEEFSFR